MNATRLREAAGLLRYRAVAANSDLGVNTYWGDAGYAAGVLGGLGGPAGDLAAVFTPPVALALADWLDHAASIWSDDEVDTGAAEDGCDCPYCKGVPLALAVADAILGDRS